MVWVKLHGMSVSVRGCEARHELRWLSRSHAHATEEAPTYNTSACSHTTLAIRTNRSGALVLYRSKTANGESKSDLDEVILATVLRQNASTVQAIRLAVAWGNPSIIQSQLERHRDLEPRGLSQALEQGLLAVAEKRLSYGRTVNSCEAKVPHGLHSRTSLSSLPPPQ